MISNIPSPAEPDPCPAPSVKRKLSTAEILAQAHKKKIEGNGVAGTNTAQASVSSPNAAPIAIHETRTDSPAVIPVPKLVQFAAIRTIISHAWCGVFSDVSRMIATVSALVLISVHGVITSIMNVNISRTWTGEWLGLLTFLFFSFCAGFMFITFFPKWLQDGLLAGHIPTAMLFAIGFALHSGSRRGGMLGGALWLAVGVVLAGGALLWLLKRMKVGKGVSDKTGDARIKNTFEIIRWGFSICKTLHVTMTCILFVLIIWHVVIVLAY